MKERHEDQSWIHDPLTSTGAARTVQTNHPLPPKSLLLPDLIFDNN